MTQQPRIIDMSSDAVKDLRPIAEPEPFMSEEDADEEEHAAAQQQTTSAVDAAKALRQLADTLVNLYARYSALHELAKELNGTPDSSPLPETVAVKKITIVYETAEQNEVTAEARSVKRVGEIGELLRSEIERLVDNIIATLAQIREISTASEQACNQAKFYNRMSQSKNVPS